ncbi:MAG: Beta-mannanase [Saliniramus fredricksonii]|uniref:Beta-mannanase n=2 Tax=Saliniramus fredricksonii TaxID=1653334 RepID=A0A0P7ZWG8_9HYPH|nr:MAG: Beta-mannanase [Saliniramus fredricksonii]SCC81597.1 Beta-mannanase [Saliniramus fredricksonii]
MSDVIRPCLRRMGMSNLVARLLLTGLMVMFAPFNGSGEGSGPAEASPLDHVAFGVYDPHGSFAGAREPAIEHIFVFWQALDLRDFRHRLDQARASGRIMMVTVEPFTRAPNWRDGGDQLFQEILRGGYRDEISTICGTLGDFGGRVLVRWGHEMEKPTGRYPWARRDARGYQAAFRHFVDQCRRMAPETRYVWSPVGERNMGAYYPGPAHVDFVGVSLWGLQSYDERFHRGVRDFPASFREKYDRAARFGKSVIIAELGVSGDRNYRENWLRSLFETLARSESFRALRAVVYFNDKEPHYWPFGLGSPDWRVTPDQWRAVQTSALQRLAAR